MLDNATPAIHPRWLAHFGQRDLTVFSAIAEEWNLRDLLRHLAETATYVFDKYPQLNVSATVWLDDPTRYELILGAAWNEPVEDPRYLPHHALPYHETDGEAPPKCFEAMKTRRQFPYKNLYADPQPRLVKYLQEQDFRSLVVTPLLDPADATRPALGALNVFARRSQVDFEGERYALQLLSALSWQAGLALRVAVDRRHTRAIAGLRAIAINCGNRDAFLTEAVKLIASPQCLNSPSCAVFLPAGTSAGPLVHLAASTDDTLMSKFEDPKEALHLNYGVGQGLTGASARLGPGHTLRIVRADDPLTEIQEWQQMMVTEVLWPSAFRHRQIAGSVLASSASPALLTRMNTSGADTYRTRPCSFRTSRECFPMASDGMRQRPRLSVI